MLAIVPAPVLAAILSTLQLNYQRLLFEENKTTNRSIKKRKKKKTPVTFVDTSYVSYNLKSRILHKHFTSYTGFVMSNSHRNICGPSSRSHDMADLVESARPRVLSTLTLWQWFGLRDSRALWGKHSYFIICLSFPHMLVVHAVSVVVMSWGKSVHVADASLLPVSFRVLRCVHW